MSNVQEMPPLAVPQMRDLNPDLLVWVIASGLLPKYDYSLALALGEASMHMASLREALTQAERAVLLDVPGLRILVDRAWRVMVIDDPGADLPRDSAGIIDLEALRRSRGRPTPGGAG